MIYILLVGILAVVIIGLRVVKNWQKRGVSSANDAQKPILHTPSYRRKSYMTPTEFSFFTKLQPLSRYDIHIIPQVNLATIIQKTTPSRYQNELFRNIDFGLFNKNYNLILLIELNDSTHRQNSRIRRDSHVRSILNDAGIPLMTFYTDKPNEQGYVLHRISEEIRKYSVNVSGKNDT